MYILGCLTNFSGHQMLCLHHYTGQTRKTIKPQWDRVSRADENNINPHTHLSIFFLNQPHFLQSKIRTQELPFQSMWDTKTLYMSFFFFYWHLWGGKQSHSMSVESLKTKASLFAMRSPLWGNSWMFPCMGTYKHIIATVWKLQFGVTATKADKSWCAWQYIHTDTFIYVWNEKKLTTRKKGIHTPAESEESF